MSSILLEAGLTNVLLASVLSLVVVLITRWKKNAHLAALLWLVVLCKFVTPPLLSYGITFQLETVAAESYETIVSVPGSVPPAAFIGEHSSGVASAAAVPIQTDVSVSLSPPKPTLSTLAWNTISRVWNPLIVSLIWLGGAAVMAAQLLTSSFRFQRLVRAAGVCKPAEGLDRIVKQLCDQMKIRSIPELRIVPAEISPLIWTWAGRTIILLPRRLTNELSLEQQTMVLVHELAHIKRWDHYFRWLEMVVQSLYWWLIPVRWIRIALHAAQEECCDEWVNRRFPEQTVAYCETLLAASISPTNRPRSPVCVSEFGQPAGLKRRIEVMFDPRFEKSLSKPAWTVCVLMGILACAVSVKWVTANKGQTSATPLHNQQAQSFAATDQADKRLVLPASNTASSTQESNKNKRRGEAANPLVTAKALTLSGTIIDPTGKPVSKAMILLASRQNYFKDFGKGLIPQTDAKGEFRIANLTPGLHKVTVFSVNWGLRTLKVSIPLTEPLRIILQKGTRVEFRAVDTAGKPIPGIAFHPESPRNAPFEGDNEINYLHALDFLSHRFLINNRTNKGGLFVWENAPAESLGYQIYGKGFLSHMDEDFGPKGSPHTLVFRKSIPVSAKVTDAETGKLIRDYQVFHGTRFKSNPPSVGWSWSSHRVDQKQPGRFIEQIRNLDRVIRYRVQAKGYRPELSKVLDAAKLPNDAILLAFPLKKDFGITGTVLQPNGSPAVGAKVYTKIKRPREPESLRISNGVADEDKVTTVTKSDPKGNFHILPHNQPYVCFISHATGYVELMDVELPEQATVKLRPWAQVEGRLLRQGKLATQIPITMHRSDYSFSHSDSEFPGIRYLQLVRTDSEGKYRFSKCVAGEWNRIITYDKPTVGPAYQQTSRLAITAGQTLVEKFGTERADLIGRVLFPKQAQVDFRSSAVYLFQWVEMPDKDKATEHKHPSRRVRRSTHRVRLQKDGSFRFLNLVPAEHELDVAIIVLKDNVAQFAYSNKLSITRKMFAGKTTENPIDVGGITVKAVVQP